MMKTWFFLLLFFWGMFWTGPEGVQAAAQHPWNASIWNQSSSEDLTITPRFSPSFSQANGTEGRSALLDNEKKPLSDANQKERSEPQGDWKGIGKDATYFLGYQAVFAGFLYILPESITSWDSEQKHATVNKWAKNVQNPTWDKDVWWVNYLGHPYFGATYYIRARERGFGESGSFLASAAFSAMYEFGIEAFFEQPSYQDLIVTPVGGLLVGKFIFEPIRNTIKAKKDLEWSDHLLLLLTDPLGAANGLVDRWLGVKSDIRMVGAPATRPLTPQSSARPAGSQRRQDETHSRPHGVGVAFDLTW